MQENEFEGQVKRIIEEFHISPPASVWEKVSRKLEKKRRPKLLPLLLLLIGLAGTAYLIFYAAENSIQSPIAMSNNKDHKGTVKADSIIVKKPVNPVTENINPANELPLSLKNINGDRKLDVNNLRKLSSPVTAQTPRVLPATNNYKAEQQRDHDNNHAYQTDLQVLQNNDSILLHSDTITDKNAVAGKELEGAGSADTVVVNNDNPSTGNQDSNAVVKPKTANELTTPIKKSIRQNYKLPNLQWGITAFYGGSNAIENLVDLNKSASASYAAPGTMPNNSDTAFYNNHPYTASTAYHVGAVVQKKIIKNGFVAAGLYFTHLSTKADVSEKVDGLYIVQTANDLSRAFTVNEYFQAGSVTYTNHYNFIELPVYFQQDILPAKKFSFSYNAGFSVRQLISSKSLIYNQYNNIYFPKDDLMRKTQLQVLAGLNLKINAGSNTSVYIGPQLSYSLSNLYKNENNGNFHFINYGLQAGLMFHKK